MAETPNTKDPEGGHDRAALDEAADKMKASEGGKGKADRNPDPPGGHDPEALEDAAKRMGVER